MAQLSLDHGEAVDCLKRGGILIYPTETFFAVGSLTSAKAALGAIYQLKGRNVQQPLPLLVGSRRQAEELVELSTSAAHILQKFWPGPLSLVCPPRSAMAQCLLNVQGKCALRVSSHVQAARLALDSGCALSASSANFSGRRPASRVEELDPLFLQKLWLLAEKSGLPVGLLLPACTEDQPKGGQPSTIIEALSVNSENASGGTSHWKVIRQGSISIEALNEAGLEICR